MILALKVRRCWRCSNLKFIWGLCWQCEMRHVCVCVTSLGKKTIIKNLRFDSFMPNYIKNDTNLSSVSPAPSIYKKQLYTFVKQKMVVMAVRSCVNVKVLFPLSQNKIRLDFLVDSYNTYIYIYIVKYKQKKSKGETDAILKLIKYYFLFKTLIGSMFSCCLLYSLRC